MRLLDERDAFYQRSVVDAPEPSHSWHPSTQIEQKTAKSVGYLQFLRSVRLRRTYNFVALLRLQYDTASLEQGIAPNGAIVEYILPLFSTRFQEELYHISFANMRGSFQLEGSSSPCRRSNPGRSPCSSPYLTFVPSKSTIIPNYCV